MRPSSATTPGKIGIGKPGRIGITAHRHIGRHEPACSYRKHGAFYGPAPRGFFLGGNAPEDGPPIGQWTVASRRGGASRLPDPSASWLARQSAFPAVLRLI